MIKGIIVSLVIAGILLTIFLLWRRQQKRLKDYILPGSTKFLLYNYVPYYRNLTTDQKTKFEERMRDFLARTKITGVSGVVVQDIDKVFIAASAIMLLYAYPKSRFYNLDEILLYPGAFNKYYDTDGPWRNIAGMVGTGVLHRQMILSQQALRAGFLFSDNTQNTAIHEFAHLIDKADGAIDGIPDYLLNKRSKKVWKERMPQYIQAIREGITDINPYGATNESEFFAVITEYYFKQPEHMKAMYPELYGLVHNMYQPDAA